MFGSWNLAMAAYNAGEGRIQKAMKRSNADNYWELLGTKHIRPETKDYVPKFIAASLIANNPQDFGFDEIEYHEPLIFDEVKLNSPIDLSVAAECAGVSLDEIKKLNPELRRWCTPPDVSRLYLENTDRHKRAVYRQRLLPSRKLNALRLRDTRSRRAIHSSGLHRGQESRCLLSFRSIPWKRLCL